MRCHGMDRGQVNAQLQQKKVQVTVLHSQNMGIGNHLAGMLESKKEQEMVKVKVKQNQLAVGMVQEKEMMHSLETYSSNKMTTQLP